MSVPVLYGELAPWFHLLTQPEDCANEAAFLLERLHEHVDEPLETLLELGSGGGNTASHLKRDLRLTLTDLSPQMIDLSLTINPDTEHLVGDMRTLRLGRTAGLGCQRLTTEQMPQRKGTRWGLADFTIIAINDLDETRSSSRRPHDQLAPDQRRRHSVLSPGSRERARRLRRWSAPGLAPRLR